MVRLVQQGQQANSQGQVLPQTIDVTTQHSNQNGNEDDDLELVFNMLNPLVMKIY